MNYSNGSVIWAAYIFALHFGKFVEESEKTVEWINDREVAAIFCWAIKQFGGPISTPISHFVGVYL